MLSVDQNQTSSSSSPDPSPCTPPFHFRPPSPPPSAAPCDDHELDLPSPRPNFSIRDYVLTARSKDIKNNWPFSLKSLQLCIKHDVKDVLPPFQSLDTARNPSLETCTVGTSSPEKHSLTNSEEELSRQANDHVVVLDPSNDAPFNNIKIPEPCIDLSSCRSGEENDFPSTTTSVSQSEIESIIPVSRQSRSRNQESGTLSKASAEVETVVPCATHKTESTVRPLGKKCRLIVKFGVNSDRSSTEDIASNCTTNGVSETMASKVCPVCKTFSSSSNTTLNAHIDQCLSVESTPNLTAGSKVTRNRIKPRKTRLIMDVYTTARRCTLEDLDRRNGTSWATVSSSPTQETDKAENSCEGKKQGASPLRPDVADGDVGSVYIDANGTKVRILSKLNPSPPASKVGDHVGAKRPLKGSKYISKKKKKRLAQKHQNHLKLAPRSKKCFSDKIQRSQVFGGQKVYNEEQKDGEDAHQVTKQIQHADSGTFRPWLRSKRRGFTKKISGQAPGQPLRCKWHLPRDLTVENDKSFSGGSPRYHAPEIAKFSVNLTMSPGNYQRKDRPLQKAQVSDKGGKSPGKKRAGISLVANRTAGNLDGLFVQMKGDADQLCKNRSLIFDCNLLGPPKSTSNHKSSPSKESAGIQKEAFRSPDVLLYAGSKSSQSSHAIVTKARRFSSFRKNILSVCSQSRMAGLRHSKMKKWSRHGRSSSHSMARKDEKVVAWRSEGDQELAFSEDHCKNQFQSEDGSAITSLRGTILDSLDERGILSRREGMLALTRSRSVDCYGSKKGTNVSSSVRVNDGYVNETDYLELNSCRVQTCEDVVIEPGQTFDGRSATNFSRFVDSEFYLPSHSIKVRSNSLRSIEDYRGLSSRSEAAAGPTEPDFNKGEHMFSCDEVATGMIGRKTGLPVEFDSEAGQDDSFPEVDPILIPGPPGSYLPSPRDMGSDDFQGNSSLTTSRVQSSPDLPDAVDGDSSDSPISAASTISNSMVGRSDLKCFEPIAAARPTTVQDRITSSSASAKYFEPIAAVRPNAVQDRIASSSVSASIDPPMRSAVAVPQLTSAGIERPSYGGEYWKLDDISIEKGSLGYKTGQPCCCQRKERFTQGDSFNNQESQLLRRRKMPSLMVPAIEQQVGNVGIRRPKLDIRPELVPTATSGSEKLAPPILKPSAGPDPLNDSSNIRVRLLTHADCDSASPSAPNPILRLMGKNLMVVNKDEESPIPPGEVQPSPQNSLLVSQGMNQTSQFPSVPTVSPAYNPNQNSHAFYHVVPQGSIVFNEDSRLPGQYFNIGLSMSYTGESDSKSPQEPVRLPTVMFREQHTDYAFATSVETHEHKDDYSLSSLQCRPKSRQSMSPTCNIEKNVAFPECLSKHADASAHAGKEIIIIDDSPKSETVVANDSVRYTEGWRVTQAVSFGGPMATASNYNQSRVYPFSSYQSLNHPPLGESVTVQHAMATKVADPTSAHWGCTSEGSGVMQRNPITSSSPSAYQLRSPALYHSSSYS